MRQIDFELTTYCNARCPFCNRTNESTLKLEHMDWKIIESIPIERFSHLMLLGNRGDPQMYPRLFDLIKHFERNSRAIVTIHTNGSYRSKEWWSDLAKIHRYYKSNKTIFALDGLEDTHSLYRKGTDYNKIIENIESYIKSGGNAWIQTLIFKHNEHQIDEMKKMLKEMGITKIWIRQSRSYNDELQRPELMMNKTRHEQSYDKKRVPIFCIHQSGDIYIRVDGEVRPCCFMGDEKYKQEFIEFMKRDLSCLKYITEYCKDPRSINLKYHTFDEVMNSGYFRAIKRDYKKIYQCNLKCRVRFDEIVKEERM
jgi:MoaA/NifB/PqqE/SkfB family radical SAM enzyme